MADREPVKVPAFVARDAVAVLRDLVRVTADWKPYDESMSWGMKELLAVRDAAVEVLAGVPREKT